MWGSILGRGKEFFLRHHIKTDLGPHPVWILSSSVQRPVRGLLPSHPPHACHNSAGALGHTLCVDIDPESELGSCTSVVGAGTGQVSCVVWAVRRDQGSHVC